LNNQPKAIVEWSTS